MYRGLCRDLDGHFNSSLPDKMGAISQTIFQMHFREWKFYILIKISQTFVHKSSIDNNPALV